MEYLLAQIAELIENQNKMMNAIAQMQAEMLELMKENKGDN